MCGYCHVPSVHHNTTSWRLVSDTPAMMTHVKMLWKSVASRSLDGNRHNKQDSSVTSPHSPQHLLQGSYRKKNWFNGLWEPARRVSFRLPVLFGVAGSLKREPFDAFDKRSSSSVKTVKGTQSIVVSHWTSPFLILHRTAEGGHFTDRLHTVLIHCLLLREGTLLTSSLPDPLPDCWGGTLLTSSLLDPLPDC